MRTQRIHKYNCMQVHAQGHPQIHPRRHRYIQIHVHSSTQAWVVSRAALSCSVLTMPCGGQEAGPILHRLSLASAAKYLRDGVPCQARPGAQPYLDFHTPMQRSTTAPTPVATADSLQPGAPMAEDDRTMSRKEGWPSWRRGFRAGTAAGSRHGAGTAAATMPGVMTRRIKLNPSRHPARWLEQDSSRTIYLVAVFRCPKRPHDSPAVLFLPSGARPSTGWAGVHVLASHTLSRG
ncbi:hypothetical protein B0H67DRAFT_575081 [Lasiosphaeris hirsuta]|uniref:Uncharacterized protein n=1 Tax=Lasiosphaeris hirsuta TaxID=260670 RepID=A0AA40AQF5_9PEZI|nr:hypothetical protein B0H67DRAFT_575081 [Lasiosphaeris hirsuta]